MEPIDIEELGGIVAEKLWYTPEPGSTYLVGSWARLLADCPGKRPDEDSDVDIISVCENIVPPWGQMFEYAGRKLWIAQRTGEVDRRFEDRGPEHRCKIPLF